jgi:hypothetical protein
VKSHIPCLARFITLALLLGFAAAACFADEDGVRLKLVWRQQFAQIPPNAPPIFFKPSSIDTSFVVRTVMQDNQLIVFDASGQPVQSLSIGSGSALHYSPSQSAATLEQFQTLGIPAGADDVPLLVTGFLNGKQVWQRTSTSAAVTLIADSGASVELNLYVFTLAFFDVNGNLLKSVVPFGTLQPWSFERPAFGAFSLDGTCFAYLATASDFTSSTLFVFDSAGNQKTSQLFAQLKEAGAVGTSADGKTFLVAGWTADPVATPQAGVVGQLVDGQGNNLGQFQIPPIGEQVLISFDPTNQEFVLNNGSGTIIRTAPNSTVSSFTVGTGLAPTDSASSSKFIVVVTLEPNDSVGDGTNNQVRREDKRTDDDDLQPHIVLRVFDHDSHLLRKEFLPGNANTLSRPKVWLSSNSRFIAVEFSDEIRYYRFWKEDER